MKTYTPLGLAADKLIFHGDGQAHDGIAQLPPPPPWRRFDDEYRKHCGAKHHIREEEKAAINAAIYLRRPLLITGKPGTGKSSLARVIAHELKLSEPLVWPVTSRSTLSQGLYRYDAIDRLQEASRGTNAPMPVQDIGRYIRLGPLGTAFCQSRPNRPCVLLIDELDKSDIDLPNDLLHLFENGEFDIPELSRNADKLSKVMVGLHDSTTEKAEITAGRVRCAEFPIVLITSNDEREFPPAFLRRCLRLDIAEPTGEDLAKIILHRLNLNPADRAELQGLLERFIRERNQEKRSLATDQLLNAVYLVADGLMKPDAQVLQSTVLRALSNPGQ